MTDQILGSEYDFEVLRDSPINQQISLPAQTAAKFIRHQTEKDLLFSATVRFMMAEKFERDLDKKLDAERDFNF